MTSLEGAQGDPEREVTGHTEAAGNEKVVMMSGTRQVIMRQICRLGREQRQTKSNSK